MQTQSYIILAIPENLLDFFLFSYIDNRGIRICLLYTSDAADE